MSVSLKLARRFLVAAVASVAPISVAMIVSAPHALAQAGEDIDLEVFYRELQPYGEWFRHERWGEVWRPNVDASWRPYTRGHWAWTEDHGWMWVAEEEWGWAVFHYGRWVFDEEEDFWIWIPGSQWAPAWVQWRESEDQIGWAPLPPDAYLDDGVMRFNASTYDSSRFARYWVFVPPRHLFEPGLHRHMSPISRQASFFRSTRPVTVHHQMYRGNVFHPGPDWRRVERWAGRPVPIVTLRTVTNTRDQGWRRLGNSPSVLPIYRPRVVVAPDRSRPPLPNVNPRAERDWRRGDDRRPDVRPADARPGRPSQPGPGGWQERQAQPPGQEPRPSGWGRQTQPPGQDPRPGRPNVQSDPIPTTGGRPGQPTPPGQDPRPGRPNVQSDPIPTPGGRPDRTGRPVVQPEPQRPPPQPVGRPQSDPRTVAGGGQAPTPWSPPSRRQPDAQPGANPTGQPPGQAPGQPPGRPARPVKDPNSDSSSR